MLDLVLAARVAHIGLYREPKTFVAVKYFFKAPSDLAERLVIVVAPVLATGNTAVAAIDCVKERGGKDIRFVCLLGAPKGSSACVASIRTFRSGLPAIDAGSTSTDPFCQV
jgi:uracil phosphoribosyltransferase